MLLSEKSVSFDVAHFAGQAIVHIQTTIWGKISSSAKKIIKGVISGPWVKNVATQISFAMRKKL